jgi:hypothetical protein
VARVRGKRSGGERHPDNDPRTGPALDDPKTIFGLLVSAAALVTASASTGSGWARLFAGLGVIVLAFAFVLLARHPDAGAALRVAGWGVAAVLVATGSGAVLYGWSDRSEAHEAENVTADKAAIRETIESGVAIEVAWYKNPSVDRLSDLHEYYLPANAGGTAVGKIVDQVRKFRTEQCRWRETADHTIRFVTVEVDGAEATALTRETYHQPRVCTGPNPPPEGHLDVAFAATYRLVEQDGRWLIAATGSPVAS